MALTALLCPAAFPVSIHGLVKDQSGAAVTGAGVELREVPGPGSARNTRTDGSGAFHFTNLAGSHYRVRVTQTGFNIYESDVMIEAGKDASLDIALSLADSRDSINVSGGRLQTVDAVYRALREADIADVYGVENVVLKRDTGILTFKKGSIGFTAPQMGRDTVMVFNGEGEFDFVPGPSVEKAHLKNLTGQEQVHENFDRAFFCFTDGTGKELRDQGTKQGADPKLTDVLRDYRRRLRGNAENIRSLTEALAAESAGNVEADLLADLYNAAARGSFTAFLHGRKHSDLRFAVKPRGVFPSLGPEEVAVVNVDPSAEQEGIWYLSHLASEFQNRTANSDGDNCVLEM